MKTELALIFTICYQNQRKNSLNKYQNLYAGFMVLYYTYTILYFISICHIHNEILLRPSELVKVWKIMLKYL